MREMTQVKRQSAAIEESCQDNKISFLDSGSTVLVLLSLLLLLQEAAPRNETSLSLATPLTLSLMIAKPDSVYISILTGLGSTTCRLRSSATAHATPPMPRPEGPYGRQPKGQSHMVSVFLHEASMLSHHVHGITVVRRLRCCQVTGSLAQLLQQRHSPRLLCWYTTADRLRRGSTWCTS